MNDLDKKISAFTKLGNYLRKDKIDSRLNDLIVKTENNNSWFIFKNTLKALKIWGDSLRKENLLKWSTNYNFENKNTKQIGIIMAGNIPLVGFHDLMCVLFTNYTAIVKTSSSDPYLIPFLYKKLIEFDTDFKERAIFKKKIDFVHAVIATGSNATIKKINGKFNSCPSILRGNRNSVAILNGKESIEELELLSNDILEYFGFGCRSITKIYVPDNYDFSPLTKILRKKSEKIILKCYLNNFKNNMAINKMINNKFHVAGKFILVESKNIYAEISSVNYEYYNNLKLVFNEIKTNIKNIQCIVGNLNQNGLTKFGETQRPNLWTYSDNIDTLEFLLSL